MSDELYGKCCADHAAVVEDWHKQRHEIEKLREALVRIAQLNERTKPTVVANKDKEVNREIEAMINVYYSLDNLSDAARERVFAHVAVIFGQRSSEK